MQERKRRKRWPLFPAHNSVSVDLILVTNNLSLADFSSGKAIPPPTKAKGCEMLYKATAAIANGEVKRIALRLVVPAVPAAGY